MNATVQLSAMPSQEWLPGGGCHLGALILSGLEVDLPLSHQRAIPNSRKLNCGDRDSNLLPRKREVNGANIF
jgi:hypothetical protein